MNKKIYKPTILTIAGSDSGGGAGIQADIKSISANGGYAASVITALTAQNTQGVHSIESVSKKMIKEQLNAVQDDLDIKAIKIGMVGNSEVIDVIFKNVNKDIKIVLDPVMVAKDMTYLLDRNSINDLIEKIFPISYLITPNIEEANIILNRKIENVSSMKKACYDLRKLGASNILIKGGHLKSKIMTDVLLFDNEIYEFNNERIETIHTHGTGCSLSSAIATYIGLGFDLNEAVNEAIAFVQNGIKNSFVIGKGKSPINHFYKK